jgi:hypothetical protein
MEKERFIEEYQKIYDSIFLLEKKLEEISKNKNLAIEDPNLLQKTREKIENQIKKLYETRKLEREIFKY